VFPTLEEAGLDLLKAMLEYDPARRISVSAARRGGGASKLCFLRAAMGAVSAAAQRRRRQRSRPRCACARPPTHPPTHPTALPPTHPPYRPAASPPPAALNPPPPPAVQAKEALTHPYFDDLDKAAVDALENPELEAAVDDDF
jgi:hypothetical protein